MEVLHPLKKGDLKVQLYGFISYFLHYLHHYWCEQALSVFTCLPVLE